VVKRRYSDSMNWKFIALALLAAAPAPPKPVPSQFAELIRACEGKDGWTDPAPPARLDGQVYLVGTCGITSLLITSPQGHVLIDSGEEEAVPLILANIRQLGFDPKDVKWLLASHTHFDHTGGHAGMQAATGAKVAALPDQASELERGLPMPDDPQAGIIKGMAPVKVDRTLADGVPLTQGQNRVTGFATPGHTRGSTSWVIRTCSKRSCSSVTYADSTSAVSADAYRFSDHPAWVAQFRRGVARVGSLPCSILVTPHPFASNLFERLGGRAAVADSTACKRYSDNALAKLDARLAKEAVTK
jgi:metallo-beta-lactamase class B